MSFLAVDPCNPVKVTAQANLYPDISGQLGLARLYRDAGQISIAGMAAMNFDVGANTVSNGFLTGWDFPNLDRDRVGGLCREVLRWGW